MFIYTSVKHVQKHVRTCVRTLYPHIFCRPSWDAMEDTPNDSRLMDDDLAMDLGVLPLNCVTDQGHLAVQVLGRTQPLQPTATAERGMIPVRSQ